MAVKIHNFVECLTPCHQRSEKRLCDSLLNGRKLKASFLSFRNDLSWSILLHPRCGHHRLTVAMSIDWANYLSDSMKLSKLYSVSYCSSSHSSPRFSIMVLNEAWPVSFCFALDFSFFFSFSTVNKSRSCPVSMVERLELSCDITVLAMFSLNFWSLENIKRVNNLKKKKRKKKEHSLPIFPRANIKNKCHKTSFYSPKR